MFWNDTTNPALGPLEVRQALDLAVDRTALLAALGNYASKPGLGPVPARAVHACQRCCFQHRHFHAGHRRGAGRTAPHGQRLAEGQ